MKLIRPIKQTYTATYTNFSLEKSYFCKLLSTTITDENYLLYDETATYNSGDFVIEPNTKRVYRSVASNNTAPLTDELSWIDWGATNSFRMFDEVANTQTKFTTTATIEITSNYHDTLSFINLKNINDIRVIQTDLSTNTVVYDKTFSLRDYGVSSLYEYWYSDIKLQTNLYIDDLLFLSNGKLTITFNSGGDGFIGGVVVGKKEDLGLTLYGTSVALKDYSTYKVDEFGNTTFIKKPYSRIINAKTRVEANMADYIFDKVASIRGEINLFVGDDRDKGFKSLITLGYIQDFNIPFSNPVSNEVPIKIVGVIWWHTK